MNLLKICSILSLLWAFAAAAAKNDKRKSDQPQGRTLGLLTPLLLGGGGLYDVPVPNVGGGGGGSAANGGGSGAQSDPLDQYGGNYGNYGSNYGYRPNYGYGYPSYNYAYPNYYRPAYNWYNGGAYQRPYTYPYNYYRPTYPTYNNYNYGSSIATSGGGYPSYSSQTSLSSSSPGAASPGAVAGSQLTQAQTAQLAGLLGQALGSQLRPLLANGGAGAAGTAAGANPQALSGLLSLLSG
ncbi:serine, glycine and glutamine-rich protein [Drosophila tropicalis]|uniref:serine, glycine and glutamine-rich protein n=1 Tax=Drosophila tropicalis TaxID=46794 RepID=UPI0035ABCB0F